MCAFLGSLVQSCSDTDFGVSFLLAALIAVAIVAAIKP
jgi:hypothetical protein